MWGWEQYGWGFRAQFAYVCALGLGARCVHVWRELTHTEIA